jgi:hypothetical protein
MQLTTRTFVEHRSVSSELGPHGEKASLLAPGGCTTCLTCTCCSCSCGVTAETPLTPST